MVHRFEAVALVSLSQVHAGLVRDALRNEVHTQFTVDLAGTGNAQLLAVAHRLAVWASFPRAAITNSNKRTNLPDVPGGLGYLHLLLDLCGRLGASKGEGQTQCEEQHMEEALHFGGLY